MTKFPIEKLKAIQTPFYWYDMDVLRATLLKISENEQKYSGYKVHYAVKANANTVLLEEIRKAGLGVDCVSGNEVRCAVENGFDPAKVVFAGVGKSDWEIEYALEAGISCFNVESVPEMQVINEIAASKGKKACIALRVNPNIDAHTHHYITTGLEENKFGIGMWELDSVIDSLPSLANLELIGLHFHIGSQILDTDPFQELCNRINGLQDQLEKKNVQLKTINVGGGWGIDYEDPDGNPVPDFDSYFATFNKYLSLRPGQELHFELGRSVVAQCGSLITKVLYVKEGQKKKFAIVDAGMNDLIRPALYEAYHKIENLTSDKPAEKYDVVGPVCESSDCFGKDRELAGTSRGDLIAMRSAGAYGEIMAMRYNLRDIAKSYYSE
ncbi:MAG: diaminopimelate decarboxylase [Bacteroidales bacterium]|nr:diaminopimelate decarboxylase [Bacteroidales bacterium]